MVRSLTRPRWSTVLGSPFAEFPREMGNMIDQFLGSHTNGNASSWVAPLSLWEEEGNFFVEVDLPGVAAEGIDVTVEKNQLRISAERKAPETERQYWYQERSFGRVERVLVLPDTVDADSIEAELKDGILHLKLAKRAEAQPKKITVRTN